MTEPLNNNQTTPIEQPVGWKVNLDIFEGPLDLLLHLINELEIDIYDIPISQITTQYLNYIQTDNVMELETGGQYIVMAATLMSIKSQMLVPRNEIFEDIDSDDWYDGEDPREHLMQLLIEYRRFKHLAADLSDREDERLMYLSKPHEDVSNFQEQVPLQENDVSLEDLQQAFTRVLNNKALREPIPTRIERSEVSVSDKMNQVMRTLEKTEGSITFNFLFEKESRYGLVTSFLAILELIKSHQIIVKQSQIFDEITIYKRQQEISDE